MITDAQKQTMLDHLRHLVAFDTQNPPRRIDNEGIFSYFRENLPREFSVDTVDLGAGCVYLHARRGQPKLLFNVHIDTVPADHGWNRDPHTLLIENNRAVGLGAADIKGAAAGLLTAISQTERDVGLLFSSDEEAGTSTCIRSFVRTHPAYEEVVVSEPTGNQAVIAHRGIVTSSGTFSGTAGHASLHRALQDSAVHEAVRWAERTLSWAESHGKKRVHGLLGLPMNIGPFHGGLKSNMIAEKSVVEFCMRTWPGQDPKTLMEEVWALAPNPKRVSWQENFVAPPLPAPRDNSNQDTEAQLQASRDLAAKLGLTVCPPVGFWTEAALFSQGGYTTLVYGPGNIEQAHTPNEWVSLSDLEEALKTYLHLLQNVI